jgi:hypothetical protein
MMCQACSEGRHWDCGLQTWCECDCDPIAALYDFNPDDDMTVVSEEDYEPDPENDEL